MKLYLCRHGETEMNQKGVYYGRIDCELTAKGRAQAQNLAVALAEISPDLVIDTPLKRARTTADLILGDRTVPRLTEPRFQELDFGAWEGKSYKELRGDALYEEWCRDWQNVRPPGGESFRDLAERTAAGFRDLQTRGDERILIVSHHAVLQILMTLLLEQPFDCCWHYRFEQGRYSYFEILDHYAVLKGHNLGDL